MEPRTVCFSADLHKEEMPVLVAEACDQESDDGGNESGDEAEQQPNM